MLLNKHGSFYIRNGWPTKIMDAITDDNHIFSPNNELIAVDAIGVGRVMIKAMRYWSCVMGIANEGKDQLGIVHSLTSIAELVKRYDPYCIDKGTLWLFHRHLAGIVIMPPLGIGRLIYLILLHSQKMSLQMLYTLIFSAKAVLMRGRLLKKNLTVLKTHMLATRHFR